MIEVKDLRFRYPGAREDTLHGLSFSVEPGEVVGLLGPSGAGKSTTVGVLTGALAGWSGEVRILGVDGPPDPARRERLGVGFEVPCVYTRLTALENLELFAAMYEGPTAEPRALLTHLGLSEVAEVRVERFSKGMRTRLDLCRALLPDPELLFLDEPTSALDPSLSRHVRRLIRRRAEGGGGVLLTTHDMHLADEVCHRVALLVDGRIVAFDTPRSLRLAGRRPPVRLEVREREELRVRECEISDLAEDEELRALLRSGRVETVHTREPSLEDVFLTLTGRELR